MIHTLALLHDRLLRRARAIDARIVARESDTLAGKLDRRLWWYELYFTERDARTIAHEMVRLSSKRGLTS